MQSAGTSTVAISNSTIATQTVTGGNGGVGGVGGAGGNEGGGSDAPFSAGNGGVGGNGGPGAINLGGGLSYVLTGSTEIYASYLRTVQGRGGHKIDHALTPARPLSEVAAVSVQILGVRARIFSGRAPAGSPAR